MDAPLIAGFEKLQLRLKIIYGRLVGEMEGIENPPRSMDRAWRGREAFQAATSEREARAERIKAALPHMEQVIRLFDPDWRPEMAKVVKPSRPKLPGPEGGWVTAAMEVLHDADAYLSGAEIVEEIARRHDLDISTVAQRQRRDGPFEQATFASPGQEWPGADAVRAQVAQAADTSRLAPGLLSNFWRRRCPAGDDGLAEALLKV